MIQIHHFKRFDIQDNHLQLPHSARRGRYCESVGRRAAILGDESGIFEVWVYPFKIISDLQLSVRIPEFNLHLKTTDISETVINRPELTSLIFSHELFSLRLHLLTPLEHPGVILLADIDTHSPLEMIISFIPNLIPMWPAGLGGQYTLWLDELSAYYIGEASRKFAGIFGSPFAKRLSETPGHQLPDQPMQFRISLTPEDASKSFIPIFVAGSEKGKTDAIKNYQVMFDRIEHFYEESLFHYQKLHSDFLTIESPDSSLNLAFEWAKIALDKGRVKNPSLGEGLVAGYGISGSSHRPGFAWFFGGDTCINTLAINCYGDFETVKRSLNLLRETQRNDGKIVHELPQTASFINWFEEYPHAFYHADTTAYYIVAMWDYFIHSGDKKFIIASKDSIEKAYQYCLKADEDNDGLMENTAAGLGAMEVGGMLEHNKVDIYLAAVWLKAIAAMQRFYLFFDEIKSFDESKQLFDKAVTSFNKIFVNEKDRKLNFALLINGKKHEETTVWQSVPLFFDLISHLEIENVLKELASGAMSADWGVRSISKSSQYYNPINYNNGSVWPFTTGFVSVAEYKNHRSVNGFQNLKANAHLTFIDSPGWQPELLSGEFYRTVTESVPHQLFSASPIISSMVVGMLGLEMDALSNHIKLTPHLPPSWDQLKVSNIHCGSNVIGFTLKRLEQKIMLIMENKGDPHRLTFSPALGLGSEINDVKINGENVAFEIIKVRYDVHCQLETNIDSKVEIEIDYKPGIEFELPFSETKIGGRSSLLKLIDYELKDNIFTLELEGISEKTYRLPFRTGKKIKYVTGAKIETNNIDTTELVFDIMKTGPNKYETKTVQIHLT